jgi:uncharacterized repeat protein (TIGR01451 family)
MIRIRTGRVRKDRSRGQSFAEFALVAPILLILFAAAADLGRLFYGYVAIENAAKEGAFFGSTKPICDDNSAVSCVNPNNVTWRVRNELSGIRNPDGPDAGTQPDELTPTVQCLSPAGTPHASLSDCIEGDTYRVGLTYKFRLLTPILGQIFGNGLDVNTTATATVVNDAIDFSPGVTIQKLVEAASANNGAAVIANCLEPLDQPSPGFYRSPCRNTNNNNNPLHLEYDTGDAILYEVTVTNSGFGSLTGVTMVDSLGWPASCAARPTTLTEGQSYTCTYTRTAPAVPGAGTQMDYINTLTVDANEINAAQDGVTVKVNRPPARLNVTVWLSPYKLGSDGDGVPGFGTLDALAIGTNATITNESVWYKVVLQNTGGQTATGITLTDTNGPLTTTPDCPAVPTSLASGATYTCLYQRAFPNPETRTNTLTAQSPDAVPTTNTDTATVTATACSGTNRVVPNLVTTPGLTKAQAQTAWTNAGFSAGNFTSWNGQNSATVVAQSLQAFSCVASSSAITVSRQSTP